MLADRRGKSRPEEPLGRATEDVGCVAEPLSDVAGPGGVAQPLHMDQTYVRFTPHEPPRMPLVANVGWVLDDVSEANGGTRFVPGSHLADTSPNYGQHYDSVAAEMEAGSVLVWHGSLWHGGGENQTDDEWRVGIASNYCAGYIRQQENQQLGIPREIAQRFPRRLQELVGYSIYNGLIGHIDKRTPADVLLGDASSSMVWDAV